MTKYKEYFKNKTKAIDISFGIIYINLIKLLGFKVAD